METHRSKPISAGQLFDFHLATDELMKRPITHADLELQLVEYSGDKPRYGLHVVHNDRPVYVRGIGKLEYSFGGAPFDAADAFRDMRFASDLVSRISPDYAFVHPKGSDDYVAGTGFNPKFE